MVTASDLTEAIESLTLEDACLCVHASLKSFGLVQGGADQIIDLFLEHGCTLVVPTFTEGNTVPPPRGYRLKQNGSSLYDGANPSPIFAYPLSYARDNTAIDRTMGTLPATILRRPQRVRGNHPHSSFAAIGPLAQRIIQEQRPKDWLAHFRELIKLQGKVLLMGVGLDRMTLVHLAEQEAGRRPFIRHAISDTGDAIEVQVGTCSRGYKKLEPHIKHLAVHKRVGTSCWQVFDASAVLEAATKAILDDPFITHCGDSTCERCNDAVLGGPII